FTVQDFKARSKNRKLRVIRTMKRRKRRAPAASLPVRSAPAAPLSLICLLLLLMTCGASFAQSGPPVIQTQPTNQNVLAGGTATFSVGAFGSPPLSFQWFRPGLPPIPTPTNATLTPVALDLPDPGPSFARVTHLVGRP